MKEQSRTGCGRRKAVVAPGGESLPGLSEFERKTMRIVSGDAEPSRSGVRVDGAEALRDQNGRLTEERDRLRRDLEKAEKEASGLRSNLKDAKERLSVAEQNLETNRARNAELTGELESKKESIRRLVDERSQLAERVRSLESGRPDILAQYNERTFAEMDSQIKSLRREKSDLDGRVAALEERNAKISAERDGFEPDAERLGGELEALRREIAAEKEAVTVTRKDEMSMSSSRFEDGNYDVRLSADLSYMTFRKDPNGKALCWGKRIFLPKLKAYVPFEKKTKYAGEEVDGMIRIRLVRRLLEDLNRCRTRCPRRSGIPWCPSPRRYVWLSRRRPRPIRCRP